MAKRNGRYTEDKEMKARIEEKARNDLQHEHGREGNERREREIARSWSFSGPRRE
jgi:hypothetical protein